jgi:hypothetical protein
VRRVGVRVAVEGPVGSRVALHHHEVAAVGRLRPGTQRALVGRRQVGLVGGCASDLQSLTEVQDRELLGYDGQLYAEPLDRRPGALVDARDHAGDHVAQTGDDLAMVLDETELDVEGDVLGEVSHRVVGLGPEHRTDLVDPFEDPDQHLLVELRALGQVRRPAEVVDLEHVRPRLGGGLHELGGVHLGEARVIQDAAEAVQAGRGKLPLRALGRVTPGGGRMVEQYGQAGVELRSPELHDGGVGGFAQQPDLRVGDLHAAGCLRVGGGRPDHLDGGLLRWHGEAALDDDLGEAGAVAQDQEGHRRQGPAAMHPARHPDL